MYNESLLEETLRVLKDRGLKPQNVQYVLTSKVWMTWEEFANIAKKVHYDSGYGIQEIEPSLKVVGIDWWLEREQLSWYLRRSLVLSDLWRVFSREINKEG